MFKRIFRITTGLIAVAALIFGVYYLRNLVYYLIISAVLALLGRPIMDVLAKVRIGKVRIPNPVSALITLLLFGLLFAGALGIIVPVILEEVRVLTNVNWDDISMGFQGPLQKMFTMAEEYGIVSEDSAEESFKQQVKDWFGFNNLGSNMSSFFGALGSFFVTIFSVGFITFFFLKDRGLQRSIVDAITPDEYLVQVHRVIGNIKQMLTRYLVGLLVQFVVFSTVVSVGLTLVGVKYALLLGVFAGMLNLIPYLGPIIGATFGIFVGLTTNIGMDFFSQVLPVLLRIAGVFAIAQLMDNLLTQPLVFSTSAKAHPIEIYLVILAAGSLAGMFGMIMAIPLYIVIRVIAKEFFAEFKFVNSLTRGM